MKEIKFDDLPGWVFTMKEISNNAYQATGKYILGNEVGCHGCYEDALDQCKIMAKDLNL